MEKAIIAVFGKDRPGILASVSEVLAERSCNIENVSQNILQRQFAGVFVVSLPATMSVATLQQILHRALEPMQLVVHVNDLETDESFDVGPCEAFIVTTKGPDRVGLVARMTRTFADHQVNVTNLKAVFKGGVNPSDNFMIYEVDVPQALDLRSLTRTLGETAEDLGLTLTIQHRNIFEAINRL